MISCGTNEEMEIADIGVHGCRQVTIFHNHEAISTTIDREDAEKIIEYLSDEFALDSQHHENQANKGPSSCDDHGGYGFKSDCKECK